MHIKRPHLGYSIVQNSTGMLINVASIHGDITNDNRYCVICRTVLSGLNTLCSLSIPMITIRYVDAYKETLLRKNWSLHGINPKAQLMVKWLTVNGNTWNIPTDKSENKKNLQ